MARLQGFGLFSSFLFASLTALIPFIAAIVQEELLIENFRLNDFKDSLTLGFLKIRWDKRDEEYGFVCVTKLALMEERDADKHQIMKHSTITGIGYEPTKKKKKKNENKTEAQRFKDISMGGVLVAQVNVSSLTFSSQEIFFNKLFLTAKAKTGMFKNIDTPPLDAQKLVIKYLRDHYMAKEVSPTLRFIEKDAKTRLAAVQSLLQTCQVLRQATFLIVPSTMSEFSRCYNYYGSLNLRKLTTTDNMIFVEAASGCKTLTVAVNSKGSSEDSPPDTLLAWQFTLFRNDDLFCAFLYPDKKVSHDGYMSVNHDDKTPVRVIHLGAGKTFQTRQADLGILLKGGMWIHKP
eukprot:GHVS01061898.1.p1 GENE.GHVS01061898.1~~GHVS01061898.1.p1  ORF type:complete len:348 (+),score=25.01 GHVS01061898.1:135-1178(+)